jgi:hypothetical protein
VALGKLLHLCEFSRELDKTLIAGPIPVVSDSIDLRYSILTLAIAISTLLTWREDLRTPPLANVI